ncbi:D-alanyl-D-alanine carboxypeptidase [Mycolicibacterium arabiense]|uniref:D-alanyl-D-alanine carboxypeptidase n=1 Tax=Mycolicibacterium arabiense TaxID=1286181 RepID=A0A7I7RW55_9MYCO|nr:serine hydrolase [Mycolicibacterium arabiense]MCV7375265.1 D-alanyl-D-alanine carboxypeptidase [Mycolicibacterium arabiense]BBY48411.1 D-alanyl-D-alanine carboxypeptidase [Mycolicibacterium arabiense]
MGKYAAALLGCLVGVFVLTAPTAVADVDIQPAGAVPVPDGPAPAWIVADMDTGQILAGRDQYVTHAPASTIKTLLALVALDELPLDATVVADESDTQVECNCAGVAAGRTYTAGELLDGLLLVSGNDAANTLAHMLGGTDAAVAKMNAKAAALGAAATRAGSPSGLNGPGIDGYTTPHDLAVIFRAALGNPAFAAITSARTAPFPTETGTITLVNQNEMLFRYPGMLGGKTGFTDVARKTYVGAAERNGRRLVVAMMFGLVREGGPTYWDQATSLLDWGFAQDRSTGIGAL